MRVAVPEYIIFLSYFCDAAMVITNVILRFLTSGPAQVGVGHQHTPIGKWTFRGAAHTIAKLMLLQTGINMIVPVSIVTYAGCFKEWMRFIGGSFAGFNPVGAQKGLAGQRVHIVRQPYAHASRQGSIPHFREVHGWSGTHIEVYAAFVTEHGGIKPAYIRG